MVNTTGSTLLLLLLLPLRLGIQTRPQIFASCAVLQKRYVERKR